MAGMGYRSGFLRLVPSQSNGSIPCARLASHSTGIHTHKHEVSTVPPSGILALTTITAQHYTAQQSTLPSVQTVFFALPS
jgi:hypothetical protein